MYKNSTCHVMVLSCAYMIFTIMIVAPWQGLAAAICYKSISFQICRGALLIIAQSEVHA